MYRQYLELVGGRGLQVWVWNATEEYVNVEGRERRLGWAVRFGPLCVTAANEKGRGEGST